MKIYLTRHGQTELNRRHLIQGCSDEPLNEKGIGQAREARRELAGISFDAVYASPLCRAVKTAELMADVPADEIKIDPRITEVEFGIYEQRKYYALGGKMSRYWIYPEVFPAPETVESIESMVSRSRSFLQDLKQEPYENVLVVCHGGIMRALCGVLENRKMGIKWRPKPKNCEIRVYEL